MNFVWVECVKMRRRRMNWWLTNANGINEPWDWDKSFSSKCSNGPINESMISNVFQWILEKSTCLRNYIMSFWTNILVWRTFLNIWKGFGRTKLARTGLKGGLFAANQTQFHANPKEADRDSRTERSSPYRYFSISGNYILNWGGDEFNHRDHNWIL